MTIEERAEAVGIDFTDPKYHDPHPDTTGPWCEWCYRHKAARLVCDVQAAEAARLNAEGSDCHRCFRCGEPIMSEPGRLCLPCYTVVERMGTPRGAPRASRRTYRSDRHGCVERVHPAEVSWESRVMGGLPDGWFE